MPNRFYRPSVPQYTSQFVEDKTPYQEMLVSQRYKAAKKEQVATQYGQLEALNASITAGARTQDIAPAVKNYWNKRLADSADQISGMSIQEATRNLSRLRNEWMNDPNVQLIRRDREEGDPEYATMRRSKTYGTDIKPFWNEQEGRVSQFGFAREIEGVEQSVDANQGYTPYETMTYTADYSQPINQLLRSIPTDTRTAKGTETQIIDGKEYKVPWTQRVGYRNLEKDKKAIMDQAQNIWDDRKTGDWQSYMIQGRGMKGVEDVYDYLVNEYSKLEQKVEYGDRSYISGFKPTEEEKVTALPSEHRRATTLGEVVTKEVSGLKSKDGIYTTEPATLMHKLLQKNINIDKWADLFDTHPELSDKMNKVIADWDKHENIASKVAGALFPAWVGVQKNALVLTKGLLDIATKRKPPEFTDDMYVYLDHIQKEKPELLKDIDMDFTYSRKEGEEGVYNLDATHDNKVKAAIAVKDYLNDIATSIKFPVSTWFSSDAEEHNDIKEEFNDAFGLDVKVDNNGKVIGVDMAGFNEETSNIRIFGGPRDVLFNFNEIKEEFGVEGLYITEQSAPENFQHPWQLILNTVGGKKKTKEMEFARVHPEFNTNSDIANRRLVKFIEYNFKENRFEDTQSYPMKPSDYADFEAIPLADRDTPEKRINIMLDKNIPFIMLQYDPDKGYIIGKYNPRQIENDGWTTVSGRTREEVVNKY